MPVSVLKSIDIQIEVRLGILLNLKSHDTLIHFIKREKYAH
jgi:hypothetical protein